MSRSTALTSLWLLSSVMLVHCSSPTSATQSRLAGSATAASSDRVSGTAPDAAELRAESEVSRLDAAEVTAFLADDLPALARLWSDDFVVTNPFNQFVNKQQVLGLVASGVLAFDAYERHIEYVHAYGDVVVVAGRETVVWAGKIPLAGQTSQLRYTAVWARHGNEWQEVARHANLVQSGAQAGPPIR
jgi:ketosteroid isomerase-like protein